MLLSCSQRCHVSMVPFRIWVLEGCLRVYFPGVFLTPKGGLEGMWVAGVRLG